MATISPNDFFKSRVTSLNSPIQIPKVTRFSDFLNSDIPEFKQSFDKTASALDDELKSADQRDALGQNRMSSLLQRTGAVGTALGRGIGDVATLGLKAFAKPETEKAVAGVMSDVGTAIAGTDVVQEIGAKYKQIEQTNPELAANIRGALGVGSAALIGAGMPLGGGGLNAVGGATRGLVEKIASESTNVLRGITDVGSSGISKAVESGLKPASIMQRVARISKGKQAAFESVAKESVGSYLVNRGIFGDIDSITSQLYKRFEQSKGSVDEALASLPGEYRPAPIRVALDGLFARESRISSPGVPSRDIDRVTELYNKVQQQGLTMSEINEVKRLYERNIKLDYLKQNLPEAVAKANTVDTVLRNWQFAKANELGLKNLPELNKETQLAKQLMDDLGKEYAGSAGNNAITLSDWIILSGGDPTAIGAFLIKKGASSKKFMSSVAEKLAPEPTIGTPTAKIAEPTMSGYAKWVDSIEGRTKPPVEPPIKIEASPSVNDNTLGKTSPAVGQTVNNTNTTAQTTAIPKIQPIVKTPPFIDRIIQQYKNLPNKEGGFIRLPNGKKVNAIDTATKEEIRQLIEYLKTSKVGSEIKSYGGAEKALELIAEKYGVDVQNLSTAKIIQKFTNLLDKTKTMDYLPGGEPNFLQKLMQKYKDMPNKQGGFANLGADVVAKGDSLASQAKGKTLDEFVKSTPKTVKVWNKSKFSNDGAYADIPVVRKEKGITLYQGGSAEGRQFWTPDKKYAEQFGEVKEKTGSFYKVDNGNRITDVYIEAPTRSQLTSIWKQANKADDLLSQAKGKTLEEFVKGQGTPVYRGNYARKQSVNDAISTSLDRRVAESFAENGKVEEMFIPKEAKIVDISTLRKQILGVENFPNPSTLTKEQFDSITGQRLVDFARKQGYDVIDHTKSGIKSSGIKIGKVLDEQEMQVVNPNILKTRSQLTDIWKKANEASGRSPI